MLPFQGLVLTSLFQATRSFVCFSGTFNHNIGSNKLIYMKESLSLDMWSRYIITRSCSYFPGQAALSFVCFCSIFTLNIDTKLIYMTESLSVPRYVILLFYYIFRVSEIYIYKECYYLMLRWIQSHVFHSLDVDQLV